MYDTLKGMHLRLKTKIWVRFSSMFFTRDIVCLLALFVPQLRLSCTLGLQKEVEEEALAPWILEFGIFLLPF